MNLIVKKKSKLTITKIINRDLFFFFLQIYKIDSDVIIHRLTVENINCFDQFQNLLTNFKALNKTIYIVSKIQPADGILSLVKKTNKIKNIR